METAATPVPLAKNPGNELDTLRWLLELYSPGKTLQCHPLPILSGKQQAIYLCNKQLCTA